MISESSLPALYLSWLQTVAGGSIPSETKATCDRCAMLPSPGSDPEALYFHPDTRCCTSPPDLPNFLAGGILSEMDPSMSYGRGALEARIAGRVVVKPSRVDAGVVRSLLYTATPGAFGRAPALRCYYQNPEAECGIWRHRPGVCATWYCKHVRGETSSRFWGLAGKLLSEVEFDLAHWCMVRLQVGLSELAELESESSPHVSELNGELDRARYRRLWGDWAGREIEFYRECARLVEGLTWLQVQEKCAPRIEILAGLVRDAYTHLESWAIPERLRMNEVRLRSFEAGHYRVTGYSKYDPLRMSERLAHVLHYFDGCLTEDALQAILVEQKIRLSAKVLRRLVDFGVLAACEPQKGLFRILD